MKNILILATAAFMASAPAFAGTFTDSIHVPEPLTMSLLAGGIVAIAAVRGLRRK